MIVFQTVNFKCCTN